MWEVATAIHHLQDKDVDDRALVGGLFVDDAIHHPYQALTSVAAWDFSTGMILGTFFKRSPREPLVDLISRVRPFLFWPLDVQARKESGA